MVEVLRASSGYRREFSLVAELDGTVIGHAMMSHAELVEARASRPALVLAPLAVSPSFRGRGAGTALMHECMGRADHAGEPLLLLVGRPIHYARFGFVPASRYGIAPPASVPGATILARRLGGYDPVWRGRLRMPDVFDMVRRDLERLPAAGIAA